MEDIGDALGHTRKDERIGRHGAPPESKSKTKIMIIGAAGICIVIILIVLFSGGGSKRSEEALPSTQARLSQLERRITHLEGMEERLVFLEKREKALERHIADYGRSGGLLAQQVDVMSEKVDQLEKAIATGTAKTEASLPHQKKLFPLAKGRYHEVRPGDTLYRIALQYGTSVEELCRLNNMTSSQIIYLGQKLLVALEDTQ